MYALLNNEIKIENISSSSSPHTIIAMRETYGDAGAVRDLFPDEESFVVGLYSEEEAEIAVAADLILLEGVSLHESGDGIICEINFRDKTDIEVIHEEIAELQDTVLGI